MGNAGPPCRIAHIITDLENDSTGKMLHQLVAHMQQGRFASCIISLGSRNRLSDRIQAAGVPVHALEKRQGRPGEAGKLLKLGLLLRRFKPDMVQGWMRAGNQAAAQAGRFPTRNIPLLWNLREKSIPPPQDDLAAQRCLKKYLDLARLPRFIVSNSYLNADRHVALGYPESKMHVIPDGFDTHLFAPNPFSRYLIRQQLGIGDDAIVIGTCAPLTHEQTHEDFLTAASFLHQQNPKIHFIVVGKGTEAHNPLMAAQLKRHAIGDNLHLLGERSDLPAVLNSLDMFALAAPQEAFPSVIGEAMACGVPCIAPDTGDTARIIGSAGRILKTLTPSTLAFAWVEWIEAGEAWRRQLGRQALQHIHKYYAIDIIAAQYQELYQEVLLPKTPSPFLLSA